MEGELSLAAEVVLLTVDPGNEGLICATRRRLRLAVVAARDVEDHGGRAVAPIRIAVRELAAAGLVDRSWPLRNIRLTDRRPAAERFHQLWRSVASGELSSEHDRNLLVLLAASGSLAQHLSTHERSIAARRLRGVVSRPDAPVVAALKRAGMPAEDLVMNLELRDAGGTLTGFRTDHHSTSGPTSALFP